MEKPWSIGAGNGSLMRLSIRNIARVEEADIELDNITVIAGYNGTGKSTISRGLYAMGFAINDKNEKIHKLGKLGSIETGLNRVYWKLEELEGKLYKKIYTVDKEVFNAMIKPLIWKKTS